MNEKTNVTIESYNKFVNEFFANSSNITHHNIIDEFLKLTNGKILDLGCGYGKDLKYISEKVEAIGIDLSEGLLQKGKEYCPKCKFKTMDMRDLDFEDNSFGGVWTWASLLHIGRDEIAKVFQEVYRILKKDGIFHIVTKQGDKEGWITDDRYGRAFKKFVSLYNVEEFSNYLEETGFEIISSKEFSKDNSYEKDVSYILIVCKK